MRWDLQFHLKWIKFFSFLELDFGISNPNRQVYPVPLPLVFFPSYQVSVLWSVYPRLFKKEPRLLAYKHHFHCLLIVLKWLILEPKGLFTLTPWSQEYSLPPPHRSTHHRSTAYTKTPHISLLQDQISFLKLSLHRLYTLGPHSPTFLMGQSKFMFAA